MGPESRSVSPTYTRFTVAPATPYLNSWRRAGPDTAVRTFVPTEPDLRSSGPSMRILRPRAARLGPIRGAAAERAGAGGGVHAPRHTGRRPDAFPPPASLRLQRTPLPDPS